MKRRQKKLASLPLPSSNTNNQTKDEKYHTQIEVGNLKVHCPPLDQLEDTKKRYFAVHSGVEHSQFLWMITCSHKFVVLTRMRIFRDKHEPLIRGTVEQAWECGTFKEELITKFSNRQLDAYPIPDEAMTIIEFMKQYKRYNR